MIIRGPWTYWEADPDGDTERDRLDLASMAGRRALCCRARARLGAGGYGSVWGALVGVLLISVLRSGVILLKIPFVPADNFPAVVGVTIIASVIFNNWLRTRSTS